MNIPWHRFFKVGLKRLLCGSCFEVHDEFDLSEKAQRVDFVIIRLDNPELPVPDPEKMPDGLRQLRDHNLISYKSMNEAFDRFALHELAGHVVAYAKIQTEDNWREFSDQIGIYAISTRKPSTDVMASLLSQTQEQAVYEIDFAGWQVTCIVINEAPEKHRNWLWELLRGERSRWKSGKISVILKQIAQHLKKMGIVDPEVEAFETEVIESWLEDIDLEKTPSVQALTKKANEQGIEQGIEQGASEKAMRVATKMIKAGKSDDEIAEFTELDLNTIQELRDA